MKLWFKPIQMMKLCRCWMGGVKRKRDGQTIPCPVNDLAVLIQAINQADSHFCGQLKLHEQVEKAREFHTVKLLQDSILYPSEEEEYTAGLKHARPASPTAYALDMDFTAAKVVDAVIDKCKLFQCMSAQYTEGCLELQTTLQGLHDILSVVQGSACLDRYKELLEEILLYATKGYAFVEKMFLQAMHNSLQVPGVRVRRIHAKFSDFACRFYNHKVQLCKQYETNANDILFCNIPRKEQLSFGVTTYLVPIHNIARRLYKNKQVVLSLTEVDGKSGYKVEFIYPRKWRSDNVGLMTKVESNDRGYKQILQAEHVKIEKGGWGWEAAQDTVLITFENLLVANVASMAGSLLRFNKDSVKDEEVYETKTYRTSIQIVGSSRIDLDLQNLFIKGTKDKDNVYLKCFVTTNGKEILAIYRYCHQHFHKAEGLLHIVGRGNQPGLRHLLVSIFSSLGFTDVV